MIRFITLPAAAHDKSGIAHYLPPAAMAMRLQYSDIDGPGEDFQITFDVDGATVTLGGYGRINLHRRRWGY